MTRARDLADSADKDIVGTLTLDGLDVAGNVSVDGGTIKLDGNYPVGTNNVALGDESLRDLTTGGNNTALGRASLTNMENGSHNTGVGQNSVTLTTSGSYNTGVGSGALQSNTTASNNTAVGYQSAYSNTTGARITAIGDGALYANTTGNDNTAVGWSTLNANTTGINNIAMGRDALGANTSGGYNVALGMNSLASNTTASSNTAVGYQAGYSNTANASSSFFGHTAGYSATGTRNTFLGQGSGYWVSSGAKNTILGPYDGNQGGLDIRTSSNNIVLSDGDGNPRVYVDSTGKTKAQSYAETYVALSGTSPAVNCNSGNAFSLVLSGNTTFTFTNPPASGIAYTFSVEVIQNSGGSGYSVTWPTSVDWPAATAPTLTADANAKDIFVFTTRDGGTNWYGFTAGQALG